ncbi:MAG: response regulator [Phycisphaerae bacterium]|nr:response regulator [Phycisphaerae bacterium]
MATILIAEDDVQILRVLAMWFSRNGHEVVECHNGVEALDKLSGGTVDLVVSDVNMPQVDGLELVRVIREERKLDLPILVLSSRCDQSSIAADLALHGIRVHPKPFSPSRLLTEVEALLSAQAPTDAGVAG